MILVGSAQLIAIPVSEIRLSLEQLQEQENGDINELQADDSK